MAANNTCESKKLIDYFKDGWKKYKQLENSNESSSTKDFQSKAKEVVDLFENATRMVTELSLFSLNEDFDEVTTTNIKYLSLPYLLGNSSEKLSTQNRIEILNIVETYYKNFLSLCKSYNVMEFELPDKKLEEKFSEAQPSVEEMTRSREIKIRRYKERKEQEALLTIMEVRVTTDPNVDEEFERKYYVILLKNFISKALDELDSIHMEKSMLSRMTELDDTIAKDKSSSKFKSKPIKPVIITRNALQKQIYGLGYPSIPIMTVDEFYEERLKNPDTSNMDTSQSLLTKAMEGINRVEEREADNIQAEIAAENDDMVELQRTRQYDDWKDDHRRGFGNRKNRS
uniref:Immunoglobulin-binding protein 1 n=1 Tax=Strigamia maritima TaxID=126957 RepID=T1JKL7_STRMM